MNADIFHKVYVSVQTYMDLKTENDNPDSGGYLMRKTVLYIAMSLDGYIADRDGDVAWLNGDGSDPNHPGSYPDFIETIDTVIMGYNTYRQIVGVLSPETWVYSDKISYVITHQTIESTSQIIYTNQVLSDLIFDLKMKNGKDIWICGGSSIVNQMLQAGLIDRFCITVIPTILGKGIRLFNEHENETRLRLISTRNYNGMTDLVYDICRDSKF